MLYTFEWIPTDDGPSGYNSVEAASLDEATRLGNKLGRSKYPGHVTLVVNPDKIWPDPDRTVLARYNQAYAGMLD
jgi:hypothetical protein